MFDVHLEWEDAPGVLDPVLASTWARIEFRANSRPIARYWSEPANAVRTGVYGSAFPLAVWIADNWWALLNEQRRFGVKASVRSDSNWTSEQQGWVGRHNIFTGREGMPYPDLAIYRQAESMVVRWFEDPGVTTTRGRFIDKGRVEVEAKNLEHSLGAVVEQVLARLDGSADDRKQELAELWGAILRSRESESKLCARLGMLGQDPYATDDDELEGLLDELDLPEDLARELLSVTTPAELANDSRFAALLLNALPQPLAQSRTTRLSATPSTAMPPYKAGYQRADEVRKRVRISDDAPVPDLDQIISQFVDAPRYAHVAEPGSRIEAAVQFDGAFVAQRRANNNAQERFLRGRALHHWVYVTDANAPRRLLTKGEDWLQASSRAFSAELLAPRRALASRLGRGASPAQLANEFNVSNRVIDYQIQNHRLGWFTAA